MPAVAVAIVLALVFAGMLWAAQLVPIARRILTTSRAALHVMHDKAMDELEKEKKVQHAAMEMFGLFALMIVASTLAFGVPAGLLWGLDRAGVVASGDVLRVVMGWPFLVGTLVAAVVIGWGVRRVRK